MGFVLQYSSRESLKYRVVGGVPGYEEGRVIWGERGREERVLDGMGGGMDAHEKSAEVPINRPIRRPTLGVAIDSEAKGAVWRVRHQELSRACLCRQWPEM